MELEYVERDLLNNISEIEISYKPKVKPSSRPIIKDSRDAAALLRRWWDKDTFYLREAFAVVLLGRHSAVLGIATPFLGGLDGLNADPRLILGIALKAAAHGIILAHNHPSGATIPSRADERFTSGMLAACKLVGIPLKDHIILGEDSYCSFADEGLLI